MESLNKLIIEDFSSLTPDNILDFKMRWSKKIKQTPKNSLVRDAYIDACHILAQPVDQKVLTALKTRQVRSLSGVTPFAVMTKPFNCPGQCTFCPLELGMPKSYLSDEPAAQRAKMFNFDPVLQIKTRMDQLHITGHHTDKIELIVIGGTFSAYPEDYKRSFFKSMFDAVNGVESANLEEAQDYNESAANRIVGISIETRPDWIDEKEVKLLRELGVTKLQVGVQALDEEILKRVKRGHSMEAVADSTQLLRDAGFKICYHFMPNLPGSTPDKDIEMCKMMYEDPRFKPDFVKIYPCMVIPGTSLHREWLRGEYKPYEESDLKYALKEIARMTPRWVRVDRFIRDISKKWVSAGTLKTNLREEIERELQTEGNPCMCIRCREVKSQTNENAKLVIFHQETQGGREYVLTFESGEKLLSLLRLRIPQTSAPLFNELKGAAIIREVHTYGQTLQLSDRKDTASQHTGFGRQLVQKAEEIAKEHGFNKVAVISAVGTRGYYKKLGFSKEGLYMTKNI
jgi:elongator complex protein 3